MVPPRAPSFTDAHGSSRSWAAIVALTRHAATELAPCGVTVNAVAPAAIDVPMVATVAPERLQAMLATIAVGRPAVPRRWPRSSRS
jgi:3-oxoacyl-[acyl-carrier protein] reductase